MLISPVKYWAFEHFRYKCIKSITFYQNDNYCDLAMINDEILQILQISQILIFFIC